MSGTQVIIDNATETSKGTAVEYRLEVVVIPVADSTGRRTSTSDWDGG
jgi:hypothetical protein